MSAVLKEIQSWSEKQPVWQQEAAIRLFQNNELTAADDLDLYAMLKAARGIADPQQRQARALTASMVAPIGGPSGRILMLAISNLENINALAGGKKIELAPEGLTVIYGRNGMGKSGYARLLKRACRARDGGEPILPNANLQTAPGAKARATFTLSIDGKEKDFHWIDGQPAPDELAAFAVFDTRCARSYMDDQGETTYSPYGMDILRGLSAACDRLKILLEREIAEIVVSDAPFAHLKMRQTDVGELLRRPLAKTSIDAIDRAATLSESELDEHQTLRQALNEANPRERAGILRQRAARFSELAGRCEAASGAVSQEVSDELARLAGDSHRAKQAADQATAGFEQAPGRLKGTGGEVWSELFQAARKFAAQTYSGQGIGSLLQSDLCPLCQQQLGEAAARLAEFDAFVEAAAVKNYREKRAAAAVPFNRLTQAPLDVGLTEALLAEINAVDESLAARLVAYQGEVLLRREAIKKACGDENWQDVPPVPSQPAIALREIQQRSAVEAAQLEARFDQDKASKMKARFDNLEDRKQLALVRTAVLSAVEAELRRVALQSCAADVRTNEITAKVGALNQKIISEQLRDALNTELRGLGVGSLEVGLRQKNVKGNALYSLALERPGEARLSAVLSEGEQRAVAIASFLADLAISDAPIGVIFDDPVSSLDHQRRRNVARRLVAEALRRQVVVLTHDIYFLSLLEEEAVLKPTPFQVQSLRRTAEGCGVPSPDLPFDGAKTTDRVKSLRNSRDEIVKQQKEGNQDYADKLLRLAWIDLRLSWERGVEEVLFNGVVVRFNAGVATMKLDSVEVTDEDVRAVFEGMTRCNNVPHDGAENAQVEIGSVDDLSAEIERLHEWRVRIAKRHNETKSKRALK